MNLFGASGHAKVIIDIVRSQGKKVDNLYDDNEELNEMLGIPVLHKKKIVSPLIISIGDNLTRKRISESLIVDYEIAIHSSSIISANTTIGEGTVVMQGAIIQSGVVVGKHCIINTGATVDHDCNIEDYVHISPNTTLCGSIFIGEGTHIGAGSVVIPGIKIGEWSVIGAGSVVTRDIPNNVLAFGNPCRIVRKI